MLILAFFVTNYCILESQTDSAFYFPMKTDDLWQYKEPPPPDEPYITETRTGRDTMFSNGCTYHSFVTKSYGYSDTIVPVIYERQTGNKVYRYFPTKQAEFPIYDFAKGMGDTVSIFYGAINPGDTNVVTVLDTGMQNIFGKLRKYITFYDKEFPTTLFWIDQITDSIGITFSEIEAGYELYLVGAVIDSVQYGVVMGIKARNDIIPKDFILFQNFPNPFNPTTTIYFRVPKGESSTLFIYNVLGQRVRMLYAGEGNGDTQSIVWDSKNDAGVRVSSGVYFYQIRSQGFLATKKMLLVQ